MTEALKAAVQIAAYVASLEPFTLWIPVAANPSYLLVFREEERQILQMLGLISSLRHWAFDTPPLKEWWTPIRHAHKKPIIRENRFYGLHMDRRFGDHLFLGKASIPPTVTCRYYYLEAHKEKRLGG
jgi:hypothetical protein